MKYAKQTSLVAIFIPLLLAVGLQGCRTATVKQGHAELLSTISDAEAARLFQKGGGAHLKEIAQGHEIFTKKSLNVSQSPLLRKAILATGRSKALTACQFPALRIELDGKKATSDWLVTSKGKGRCTGDERYFWILQQNKAEQAKILLAGRGSSVFVKKPKNSALSELSVRNGASIKINSGDKLANGGWVQVKSSDKGRVEITCYSKFRLQNDSFQAYEESVEASVNTAMMSGKSWQPVDNPRYRCPF